MDIVLHVQTGYVAIVGDVETLDMSDIVRFVLDTGLSRRYVLFVVTI